MSPSTSVVPPDAELEEVIHALRTTRYGAVLVVGADRRLIGLITMADLVQGMGGHALPPATAEDLVLRDPPRLTADDDLMRAMALMDGAGESHLPVVDSLKGRRLVGFVHEHDVMLAYHRALLEARTGDPTAGRG